MASTPLQSLVYGAIIPRFRLGEDKQESAVKDYIR